MRSEPANTFRRCCQDVFIVGAVFALFLGCFAFDAYGRSDSQEERETARKTVSWVKNVGVIVGDMFSKGGFRRNQTRALEESDPTDHWPEELQPAFAMYRCELKILSGDTPGYRTAKRRMLDSDVVAPDVIDLEYVFRADLWESVQDRRDVTLDSGRFRPLSWAGTRRDFIVGPFAGAIDPPLVDIPQTLGLSNRLRKVAEVYRESAPTRELIDSLLEALYAEPVIIHRPQFREPWLRIATYEEQMGERLLAVRAYLNAVHNDPACEDEVATALARLISKDWRAPKHTSPLKPALSLENALEIADLYRQSNLHPMALRVLAGFDLEPEGPEAKVRDEIAQEWAGIVRRHRLVRGPTCVILGQKVDDVQDWAAVKIPRPSDLFWKPQSGTTTKPAGGK
jgi:hypothetical protein